MAMSLPDSIVWKKFNLTVENKGKEYIYVLEGRGQDSIAEATAQFSTIRMDN